MSPKNREEIIVVANDAGGGEILAAYIKTNPDKNFVSYVAGPASLIFEREGIAARPATVETVKEIIQTHQEATLVLTGTGWMTPIERLFIFQAKAHQIPTAAFLDHWINYRERFGYPDSEWENNLPDQIWVGDEYAAQLANTFFPHSPVRLITNPHLKTFAERYKLQVQDYQEEKKALLFIGEPNSYAATVLESLLDYLIAKHFAGQIILRPHPAESPGRYDWVLKKYSGLLSVVVSTHPLIIDDLVASRVVVGMESAALVVALYCDKPTFSFIPDPQLACPLPFPQLTKLKSVQEFSRLDQYLI